MSCDGSHGSPGTYRTRHAPGEALLSRPLPVAFAHPAAELTLHPRRGDGDGVPLVLGHDHSFALYPGHILRVRARQPTTNTAGIRNSSGRKRRGELKHTRTGGVVRTSSHIWEASSPSLPSPDLPRYWLFPAASPSPRARWRAYIRPPLPSQSPPPPSAARGRRPGNGRRRLPRGRRV